jgi:hypothetical protein
MARPPRSQPDAGPVGEPQSIAVVHGTSMQRMTSPGQS